MIFPLLLIGAGTTALIALVLSTRSEEPAPPVDMVGPPAGGSGIPLDEREVEALARVIASEAGSGTRSEQLGIAWSVRNRFRGKSIYAVEHPWRSQKGSDPPFSSARPAKPEHYELARQVLAADQSQDPTGGATSFFEHRMQDIFAKAGEMARRGETGDRVIDGVKLTDITRFKNYRFDADAIRKRWSPSSSVFAVAGRFEFWGNSKLFAQRGGEVKEIVGAAGTGGGKGKFDDIIDPLDCLNKG